jgi:transposase
VGFLPKRCLSFAETASVLFNPGLKKVDESGWDSLYAVKQGGRPKKLSDQQIAEIKSTINAGPEASGYNVWDGPALSDYIKKKYGIDYGVRACQLLMHRMGFSLIRPQTYPSLGNPDNEARESFKKN